MTAEEDQILPELVIEVTPTFVVASAIGTRDFQDVHHDKDQAIARGSQDIFVNILTTTGLVQRYVTDWAGPGAIVRQIAIRLGVPCYAGDTLTFSGRVVEGARGESSPGGGESGLGGGESKECVVEVVGRCALGDHVTGTVRLGPAGSAP
jgi:acyl dehydratase